MIRHRALTIAGWTVVWLMTLMLVVVFGMQGLAKFSATSGWATAFAHWGYPVWFRILIGGLEMLAALLLVWPRSAPLGALLVIVIMAGGLATHVLQDHGRHMESELGPLIFASVILFARRRQATMAMIAIAGLALALPGQTPSAGVTAIVDRHIAAVGGRAALERQRARVLTGDLVVSAGTAGLTIYQAPPSRFLVIIDSPASGLSKNAFDGAHAWSENANGLRDVSGPEAGIFVREYDMRWALHFAESYPVAAVGPDTTIDGRRLTRIDATASDGVRERLFFDATTDLLARRQIVAPVELIVDLSDYRRAGEVVVPFTLKHTRPGFTWTNQLKTVSDSTLSDTLFTRPRR